MKIRGSELTNLIKYIVKEEVKKALPEMVKECLTESYLKKLVYEKSNNVVEDRTRLEEEIEESSEDIPEPLDNETEGIYSEHPLAKHSQNEVVSRLFSKKNPLSFIYEGIKPISHSELSKPESESSIPLEALKSMGADFSVMKTLAGNKTKSKESTVVNESYKEKLRELEERRRALEVPVVSSKVI